MKRKTFNGIISVVILIACVAVIISAALFPYWTEDSVTFTVTDKERVVKSSGESISSKYLVFTETEVFQNTDCFFRFKFNSSDVQGALIPGKSYAAKVYGWRVPFFSWYRNILSVSRPLQEGRKQDAEGGSSSSR